MKLTAKRIALGDIFEDDFRNTQPERELPLVVAAGLAQRLTPDFPRIGTLKCRGGAMPPKSLNLRRQRPPQPHATPSNAQSFALSGERSPADGRAVRRNKRPQLSEHCSRASPGNGIRSPIGQGIHSPSMHWKFITDSAFGRNRRPQFPKRCLTTI